jgi:hypothetical protein
MQTHSVSELPKRTQFSGSMKQLTSSDAKAQPQTAQVLSAAYFSSMCRIRRESRPDNGGRQSAARKSTVSPK